MSTNTYVGQGTLPPELEQRVLSELGAGERLVWVGQPLPHLYRGQTACLAVFGVFFMIPPLIMFTIGLVMTVAVVVGAVGQGAPAASAAGCFPLFFVLFTLPFLAIGGALATSPFWMPARVRKILYALTDRRALVWEPGWFSGYTVRSFTREGLGRMYRVDRGGVGDGDLVFEEYYTSSTDDSGFRTTRRNQRGFLAIGRVREVEELVRLTLLE